MLGMNRAMLLGHAGRNPEMRKLPSGDDVAQFSLATTERFRRKDDTVGESTEWHSRWWPSAPRRRRCGSWCARATRCWWKGESPHAPGPTGRASSAGPRRSWCRARAARVNVLAKRKRGGDGNGGDDDPPGGPAAAGAASGARRCEGRSGGPRGCFEGCLRCGRRGERRPVRPMLPPGAESDGNGEAGRRSGGTTPGAGAADARAGDTAESRQTLPANARRRDLPGRPMTTRIMSRRCRPSRRGPGPGPLAGAGRGDRRERRGRRRCGLCARGRTGAGRRRADRRRAGRGDPAPSGPGHPRP